MATPRPNVIVLADDRRLAWREYGVPDGRPCVYTPGTPASGLAGALHHEAAERAGVRWISVDKPGYGLSDFQPGRQLLDWPKDVAALADHLCLDRFAVAGESGGGPHVLALGYGLTDRLTVAVVLAGMGPGEHAWVQDGMKRQNTVLLGLAQTAPWALAVPMALMGWVLRDERRAERYLRGQAKVSPPADRELFTEPTRMAAGLASARDAFRFGFRGATQEMELFARPWGFALADVRAHVELWHGTADVNVPVGVAQRVVSELPDCTAHIIDGAGHAVAWTRLDEIMKVIADA
ncbi:MAG: alpha/beta fold hydrolase [Mycobacteriales bacterium]